MIEYQDRITIKDDGVCWVIRHKIGKTFKPVSYVHTNRSYIVTALQRKGLLTSAEAIELNTIIDSLLPVVHPDTALGAKRAVMAMRENRPHD